IASLGTTGVLLGAAILMLGVVSAVVAFNAWPNGHVSTRVQTLVLAERPQGIPVALTTGTQPRATGLTASGVRTSGGLGVIRLPIAQNLRPLTGERVGAVAPPGGGATKPPTTPLPNGSQLPDTGQLPVDTAPLQAGNAQGLAGAAADQEQLAGDQAGVSVGRIDPSTGDAVSSTVRQAADTVR